MCVAGSCEAAYPRVYDITDIQVGVPTTKPDGSSWDVGGGAPDLYVKISVNGTLVTTTSIVQDQFSASFPGPFEVTLSAAGSTLDMHAYDSDVTSDDDAFDCVASPITSAELRGHALSCSASGNMMTFSVQAK